MVIDFQEVDEFYIDAPNEDDPDEIVMGFVVKNDEGQPGVVKIRLHGDTAYIGNDGVLSLPQSEDFLEQFAATMGYRIDKTVEGVVS